MTIAAMPTRPVEDPGALGIVVLLIIGLVMLAVLIPVAVLTARDARASGRNPWVWSLLFVWQPMIVGIVYLIVRRHPPRGANRPPAGWYEDPEGAHRWRWWDGHQWTPHVA
jgi:uncharacterized membrane protein YhaH (DUF805 family)